MYLALWLIRRCRLPATPALSLPEAVILKRFLAPDLVFSFGISRRGEAPSFWSCLRAALACLGPGGSEGRGCYVKGGAIATEMLPVQRPPSMNERARAQRGARIMIIWRPSMR